MLAENPEQRPDFDEALEGLKKIGKDEDETNAAFEYYIKRAREVLEYGDPAVLSLKNDIKKFEKVEKIVAQYVATDDPRIYRKNIQTKRSYVKNL